MRPAAALTVLSCLLVAGCGGSGGETSTTAGDSGGGMTLEELWRAPGDDVAIISGTSNHEPGDVRVSFLVVDAEGRVITLPTARVWVAESLEAAPFLASTGGDLSKLTTRTPPDESLLEYSIADSLRAKAPFVVTFSTPKFCSSRTCGPVVDVVEEVAGRFEGGDVRFIHVEVYAGNDPAKGLNRWMHEW